MRRQITLENEQYTNCPDCNGKLVFQKRWDDFFDRYDINTPSFDLVIKRLHKEKEPKYICESCKLEILVK